LYTLPMATILSTTVIRMLWKSMLFFTEQCVWQILTVWCKVLMFWIFLLPIKGLCYHISYLIQCFWEWWCVKHCNQTKESFSEWEISIVHRWICCGICNEKHLFQGFSLWTCFPFTYFVWKIVQCLIFHLFYCLIYSS